MGDFSSCKEADMLTPLNSTEHIQDMSSEKTCLSVVTDEFKCIAKIALPLVLTGLLLYSRSMISMMFLGRLGELALAGGSLAIGFANITGYSVLSGLSMGMEPICGQAFGAKRYKILGLAMQKMILLLLSTSIIIASLWLNMKNILLLFRQDVNIANEARVYILYSLPDLVAQSVLHPLRAYLRTQSITLPLTCCSAVAILLHIPINYLLVSVLNLGIKGVALGSVWTNINLVALLIIYVKISGVYKKTWDGISSECLKGWKYLLELSIPSCFSVCLEWWWYEIMILLCGLLLNPQATIASMGILIQTTSLIYIFPSSLSFGVSTRVGNELGADNPNKAKLAAIIGLSSSWVLGILASVFAILVRKKWATMFTEDPKIIALTTMVLPILGLCELGNCPQTTVCGVLRGTARPKLGAKINLRCFYLIGMPIALCLSFFAGFDFKGLWVGLVFAQGSCMVAMLFTVARTDWDYEAWRAQQLTTAIAFDGDDEVDSSVSKESCFGLLHDVNQNDLLV
ncbi:hypothetical protein F3Y22_tig00110057pilonHSYRG00192 [Hibiscus syriacus]|uniref:Protein DETOXIFICATION n=1 Tax=Hibiscus syriacus TaxID=106335 RepID=A0A6A3BLJ9_HIBSY|nr:protein DETOXIFICATION 49-like [Hibiscus syriacus]KAE8717195.1 hypothetical protein F3Y22_tig00110057pilonHSYRG00192 [Hibiscus syriacus]